MAIKRPYMSKPYNVNIMATRFERAKKRLRQKLAAANPRFARRGRSRALANVRTGGLLGIETKFLDCQATDLDIPSPTGAAGGEMNPEGGCTGCLTAPATGDGPTNRDGNRIAMKSILVKGLVQTSNQSAQSAADIVSPVFLALVLDTQTNGATLNSEDVYTNPSANAQCNVALFRNMSFTSRFKVLASTIVEFPSLAMANNTGAAGGIVREGLGVPFTLSANLKGLKVQFTTGSTTADVANVIDNSVHLLAFSTDAADAMNYGLTYNSRLRFVG